MRWLLLKLSPFKCWLTSSVCQGKECFYYHCHQSRPSSEMLAWSRYSLFLCWLESTCVSERQGLGQRCVSIRWQYWWWDPGEGFGWASKPDSLDENQESTQRSPFKKRLQQQLCFQVLRTGWQRASSTLPLVFQITSTFRFPNSSQTARKPTNEQTKSQNKNPKPKQTATKYPAAQTRTSNLVCKCV